MKNPTDLESKIKEYLTSQNSRKEKDSPCFDPEWIGGYVEGSLTAGERKKVERHLSDCNSCLEEFIFLKKLLIPENMEKDLPEHLNFTLQKILEAPPEKFSINCFKCGKEICEGDEVCPGCGLKLTIGKDETDLKKEIKEWLPDFLKENRWMVGTVMAFAASFAFPSALFQFLLAAGLMGGMWIFEKNKLKLLEEIKEALEKGERKKAERLVEKLEKEINRR